MKRDTVINVLLIIAGIVLAIALFGAGVLWKRGAVNSPKMLSSAPAFAAQKTGGPDRGRHVFRISIPR